MYWPNGVPRVYAVNGSCKKLPEVDDEFEGRSRKPQDGETSEPSRESEREKDSQAWTKEPIIGLCVSRNKRLFATITDSSLTIWQTRVCRMTFFLSTKLSLLTRI